MTKSNQNSRHEVMRKADIGRWYHVHPKMSMTDTLVKIRRYVLDSMFTSLIRAQVYRAPKIWHPGQIPPADDTVIIHTPTFEFLFASKEPWEGKTLPIVLMSGLSSSARVEKSHRWLESATLFDVLKLVAFRFRDPLKVSTKQVTRRFDLRPDFDDVPPLYHDPCFPFRPWEPRVVASLTTFESYLSESWHLIKTPAKIALFMDARSIDIRKYEVSLAQITGAEFYFDFAI